MINLFVEFGFQPLNMEALLDFELIERSSIINNFEARNITIIVTIFRLRSRCTFSLSRQINKIPCLKCDSLPRPYWQQMMPLVYWFWKRKKVSLGCRVYRLAYICTTDAENHKTVWSGLQPQSYIHGARLYFSLFVIHFLSSVSPVTFSIEAQSLLCLIIDSLLWHSLLSVAWFPSKAPTMRPICGSKFCRRTVCEWCK